MCCVFSCVRAAASSLQAVASFSWCVSGGCVLLLLCERGSVASLDVVDSGETQLFRAPCSSSFFSLVFFFFVFEIPSSLSLPSFLSSHLLFPFSLPTLTLAGDFGCRVRGKAMMVM